MFSGLKKTGLRLASSLSSHPLLSRISSTRGQKDSGASSEGQPTNDSRGPGLVSVPSTPTTVKAADEKNPGTTISQPPLVLRRHTRPPPINPGDPAAVHSQKPTSIVFVGNPGVGKSALLNALGGHFQSGFNHVSGLTTEVATQEVILQGRKFQLVDMPGMYDSGKENAETFLRHLDMLQTTLNDKDREFIIFFVVMPRNGRVRNIDLALMKLVLDSIDQGPIVGLILTQIRKMDLGRIQKPAYLSNVFNLLRRSDCKNMQLLDDYHETLVLRFHESEEEFSHEEVEEIQNYILSFTPSPPGAGKSALLNAVGGNFPSGFSEEDGAECVTTRISHKDVTIGKRPFRLVDTPGIDDRIGEATDDEATNRKLEMLQNTLNDGHAYAVFFVISPINGRIDPGALALIQLVLSNMERGPTVGLILTQVPKTQYNQVRSEKYFAEVFDVLRRNKANLDFLDTNHPLVLRDHDEEFSTQERYDIEQYILSFKPKQVTIRKMVVTVLRALILIFVEIIKVVQG
ncbi:hypothetical protein BGZ83_011927 [Gryganskiella cystojenkinii]|nr:hypothetical protein BGZ83_011927 [Gryganskiella cystojenkinii]